MKLTQSSRRNEPGPQPTTKTHWTPRPSMWPHTVSRTSSMTARPRWARQTLGPAEKRLVLKNAVRRRGAVADAASRASREDHSELTFAKAVFFWPAYSRE